MGPISERDAFASYGSTCQTGAVVRARMDERTFREMCDDIRWRFPVSAVAAWNLKLIKSGKEWKACCPFHADRTPSFTILADDRHWWCFGGCGGGDVLDFIQRLNGVTLIEAVRILDSGAFPVLERRKSIADPSPSEDRRREAAAIWQASVQADETTAGLYLRRRGLDGPLPAALRFARLKYGNRGPLFPCLVALVVDVFGAPQGIQRTYLTDDGTKAFGKNSKRSLGRIKGGAVRLAEATGEIVICEGVEDALSLQSMSGIPGWAAAGAGMMSAMLLPKEITAVTIGADADETGERAARSAATSFHASGRDVRILRPLQGCKDFNQELQEAR